jgi:hypothetical protein
MVGLGGSAPQPIGTPYVASSDEDVAISVLSAAAVLEELECRHPLAATWWARGYPIMV